MICLSTNFQMDSGVREDLMESKLQAQNLEWYCSTKQHSTTRVNISRIGLICEIRIPVRSGSQVHSLRESCDWVERSNLCHRWDVARGATSFQYFLSASELIPVMSLPTQKSLSLCNLRQYHVLSSLLNTSLVSEEGFKPNPGNQTARYYIIL